MNENELKYVVGKAETDQPSIIRFFGDVNRESVERFNEEFLWLQDYVKPSKIVVLINSDGGSVMYGMSTFSIIQACPIEVDCVIEGIAASMGSVIWAAGDNLYMHDYSILMIHNPFSYYGASESMDSMIEAFRTQLETIYHKRFGLPVSEVKKIMDGEGASDGTYFNAKQAVDAGIISKKNIIKTPKLICDTIKNQIEGVTSVADLRDIMACATKDLDLHKLLKPLCTINNKHDLNIQNKQTMEEKQDMNFGAIVAQLGLAKDVHVTNVSARIADLLGAESKLATVTNELEALKIQFAGKETEAKNLNEELSEVKASLNKYKEAEQAAFEAEVLSTVQAAIEAGKIDQSAQESWVAMGKSNFEVVKATLASIQGREKITKEIANDADNVQSMKETLKTVEEKIAEQVEAVVGKLELKTF